MKKLFFSLVAVLMAATATFAQSTLLATLSHEGNITVFHGPSSYNDAMTAAVDGDVISLAGGIYQAINITKGITVRGSGYEKDTISNTYPSEIQGDFTINVPDSCSSLVIEGVNCTGNVYYINVKNPSFMKSKLFKILENDPSDKIVDLTMLHCYVRSGLHLTSSSTANLINSCIYTIEGSSMDFTNCYVSCEPYRITKSIFRNCLIYSQLGDNVSQARGALPSDCMVYNCLGYGNYLFYGHGLQGNITLGYSKWSTLFARNKGLNALTDEAKAKYKGDDGTEVGLYGGSLPFDPRVAKPQITKCNIAQKTTADGKLSVDIEVKGVE